MRYLLMLLLIVLALAACGASAADALLGEWTGDAEFLVGESDATFEFFEDGAYKLSVSGFISGPSLGTFSVADNFWQLTLTSEDAPDDSITLDYAILGDRLTITDPESGESGEFFKQ